MLFQNQNRDSLLSSTQWSFLHPQSCWIKDSSCNNSKTYMQWFMIRCHACILTWFWNIGPTTLPWHELAFEVVCWIHFSCCPLLPIISLRRSLRLFTSSFFKIYDLIAFFVMLLSNALTYLFQIYGLSTRKTFHEISFIAPSVGCDRIPCFYKEENHSGSNGTTNNILFREWRDNEIFSFQNAHC